MEMFDRTDGETQKVFTSITKSYIAVLQELGIPVVVIAVTRMDEDSTRYDVHLNMPTGWENDKSYMDIRLTHAIMTNDAVRNKTVEAIKLYQDLTEFGLLPHVRAAIDLNRAMRKAMS